MAHGNGGSAAAGMPARAGSDHWRPGERSLSRDEENALAVRLLEGDTAAAQRLIVSHLPFIVNIARRYSRYGPPLNDLVHEGVVGLIQAVRRFSPERDVRLSTFAVWWVRAAIQEHVVRSWSLVRIGTTAAQKALFFRLRRLAAEAGAGAVTAERMDERLRRLAARFGLKPEEIRALAARIGGRDYSLNQPAGAGAAEWLELVPDPRPSPEQRTVAASETRFWRQRLTEALQALPPREQLIIRRRYFAEAKVSFETIARELGLSKERVRQLEAKALNELRDLIRSAITGDMAVGAGRCAGR